MGTELFKVTCVTCRASLSVRNPALIDQIVACPKCESMVHVVPPVEPAPTPVIAPVTAAPPLVERPAFEEPFEESIEPPQPVAETPSPIEVASVLDVAGASNTGFIMWAVASFVVGVTLMGAFLLLRGGREQSGPASPQAALPVAEASISAKAAPSGRDDPGTDPVTESAAPSPGLVADEDVAVDDNPIAQTETEPAEATLLGPIEQPTEEAAVEETQRVPIEEQPVQKLVIASADEPRVARKFDPLAVDPEELNLGEITEADDQTDVPAVEKPSRDDAEEEIRPLNAVVPVRLVENSGRDSANRIATIQLKRELPALAAQDMPLLDFLGFMTQLAGVPVSVGPEQLQMAGITPGRPVSISVTGETLGSVLKKVLGPLNLEPTADGPQIVVIRQDAAKVRSVDYPVDDLLGDGLSAADVGKWIEQLIAPESWKTTGGNGTIAVASDSLRIEQSQDVQYQILFFLERIRMAKGMPLRSKYPARLLSQKPYTVGIADRLDAPATFTFSHDTPLAEVLHYWQGEMGVPIFIDWPALATVDLWPDSRVTCTSANEPWQTALDKILGPLDLGWRAAPGGAIQITSRARVKTEPVVDIYPTDTWRGDATDAVVIEDALHGLTYVRAPASRLQESN